MVAAHEVGAAGGSTARQAPAVVAFVKNEFLEFAIPYVDNGQDHDYYPDFLVRLADEPRFTLIIEVKGRPDPLEQVKARRRGDGWRR